MVHPQGTAAAMKRGHEDRSPLWTWYGEAAKLLLEHPNFVSRKQCSAPKWKEVKGSGKGLIRARSKPKVGRNGDLCPGDNRCRRYGASTRSRTAWKPELGQGAGTAEVS